MQRLLWFGLFSLLGISGLFAARTVAGVTVIKRGAPDAIAADVAVNDGLPLAKGDRLLSPFLNGALPKTVVDTVKITPTETPQQSARQKMQLRAGTGTKARRSSVAERPFKRLAHRRPAPNAVNLNQHP